MPNGQKANNKKQLKSNNYEYELEAKRARLTRRGCEQRGCVVSVNVSACRNRWCNVNKLHVSVCRILEESFGICDL